MLDRLIARLSIHAVTIGLLILALVVQTVRIEGVKLWPFSVDGYRAELRERDRTIAELTKPKNEQRRETQDNIDKGNERIVFVDRIVKQIESRPLPPDCATPDEEQWGAVL